MISSTLFHKQNCQRWNIFLGLGRCNNHSDSNITFLWTNIIYMPSCYIFIYIKHFLEHSYFRSKIPMFTQNRLTLHNKNKLKPKFKYQNPRVLYPVIVWLWVLKELQSYYVMDLIKFFWHQIHLELQSETVTV
jgi:hypothetical protein